MLKYQVESIEELDESVQALYTEQDGAYVLAVDGIPQPEDTSGLKNKLNELMTEAKEAKRKARELEESKNRQEEDSAKEKGEFKTLWEQAQQRLSEKERHLLDFLNGTNRDALLRLNKESATRNYGELAILTEHELAIEIVRYL